MKKITSLFKRDYEGTRLVFDEIVPGSEWVVTGEGFATRKWDGTCCMIKNGLLLKRYELKKGKACPVGFVAAQEPDAITGDQPGWVPVSNGPEDAVHREAFSKGMDMQGNYFKDGTYELLGPKINKNPDSVSGHWLHPHGVDRIAAPRTFYYLGVFFQENDIEGIVWHHPDGRMVKIKAKDFGIKRGTRK